MDLIKDLDKLIESKIDRSKWQKWKFSDLVENINEKVVPKDSDLDHYIGLEHLDSGSLHIRRFGETKSLVGDKLKIYKGDIIFAKRNAYLKRVAVAHLDAVASAHSLVLRPKKKNIVPEFLPFFLLSETFWGKAIEISVGSLSPTINWPTLAKQEFYLPPESQQTDLAKLLWGIDEVIQSNKKLLNNFNLYSEVLSNSLLGLNEITNNKKEWVTKSLLDVAPLQRGFDLPNGNLVKGNYPVCYSNGIGNYHENYMVKGPGVCTGRSGTIGNVFYIESDYWPHNTTLWVTDFKNNYPRYIYHLYSKLNFEKKMTGTGVPTLNRNEIHKIKVSIPKYQDQINISNQIDELEKKCATITDYIDFSIEFQKSLINKIF